MATNIKTFVLATIKPLFVALRDFCQHQVDLMAARDEEQTKSITQLQTLQMDTYRQMTDTLRESSEVKERLVELNNKVYTHQELLNYIDRVDELEAICLALYNAVIELKQTGHTDIEIPPFDDPFNKDKESGDSKDES